jgi:hypothetical protein
MARSNATGHGARRGEGRQEAHEDPPRGSSLESPPRARARSPPAPHGGGSHQTTARKRAPIKGGRPPLVRCTRAPYRLRHRPIVAIRSKSHLSSSDQSKFSGRHHPWRFVSICSFGRSPSENRRNVRSGVSLALGDLRLMPWPGRAQPCKPCARRSAPAGKTRAIPQCRGRPPSASTQHGRCERPDSRRIRRGRGRRRR